MLAYELFGSLLFPSRSISTSSQCKLLFLKKTLLSMVKIDCLISFSVPLWSYALGNNDEL